MKTIAWFVIGVFVILATAIPAEAQRYYRDDPRTREIQSIIYGGGSYQRYEPYYDQRYDYRYGSRYRRGRTTVKDIAILGGVLGGVIIAGKIIDSRNKQVEVPYEGGQQPYLPPPQEKQPTTPPVVSPVDPLANITWLTVNTTSFRAVVTDPNNGDMKLIPAGGSMSLREPAGEQPYTVILLEPGRGKSNPIPGEIIPSKDLQGWEIVARQE